MADISEICLSLAQTYAKDGDALEEARVICNIIAARKRMYESRARAVHIAYPHSIQH